MNNANKADDLVDIIPSPKQLKTSKNNRDDKRKNSVDINTNPLAIRKKTTLKEMPTADKSTKKNFKKSYVVPKSPSPEAEVQPNRDSCQNKFLGNLPGKSTLANPPNRLSKNHQRRATALLSIRGVNEILGSKNSKQSIGNMDMLPNIGNRRSTLMGDKEFNLNAFRNTMYYGQNREEEFEVSEEDEIEKIKADAIKKGRDEFEKMLAQRTTHGKGAVSKISNDADFSLYTHYEPIENLKLYWDKNKDECKRKRKESRLAELKAKNWDPTIDPSNSNIDGKSFCVMNSNKVMPSPLFNSI